jgi:prepilin signal peptidase PulO-like enzyme (type II secretory pathway)
VPFVLIETIFQLCINRGKDEERFLVGGGDMILFATMSLLLSLPNMIIMLFVACFISLVVSKIIKKTLIHFAPFIQIGFLTACLFGEKLLEIWVTFNNNLIH